MKVYVLLVVLCVMSVTVYGQNEYIVAQVKGKVIKADGTVLKPGSKLSLEDKVKFDGLKSVLILVHPQKGRIVISPEDGKPIGISTLSGKILEFLSLRESITKLSSKSSGEKDSKYAAMLKKKSDDEEAMRREIQQASAASAGKAFSGDYLVANVKGVVLNSTGIKIITGMKLTAQEKLVFSNKAGVVVLLHPTKGRLVITAAKAKPTTGNSFTTLIKDFLQLNESVERGSAGNEAYCLKKITDTASGNTMYQSTPPIIINRNVSVYFFATTDSTPTIDMVLSNKNIAADSLHTSVTFLFENGHRYTVTSLPTTYFRLPVNSSMVSDLLSEGITTIIFTDINEKVYGTGFVITKRFSCFYDGLKTLH